MAGDSKTLTVVATDADVIGRRVRLDVFLVEALQKQDQNQSRSKLKSLIEEGSVAINGRVEVSPAYIVQSGDQITLQPHSLKPSHLIPVAMALDVLFEDEYLLVINKPAGVAVHPGAGIKEPTLVEGLLHHCGGKLSHGGGLDDADEDDRYTFRPGIVHRLDKDTTGALVIAKTDEVHRGLATQFQDKTSLRQYVALLNGVWSNPDPTVESFLRRDERSRIKFKAEPLSAVHGEPPSGWRYAKSVFAVEAYYGSSLTLASVRLFTGRTHQIRVHAQWSGVPVVGDPVYKAALSAECIKAFPSTVVATLQAVTRQLLHAWLLEFTHPISKQKVRFEAPLPKDFADILQMLKSWQQIPEGVKGTKT